MIEQTVAGGEPQTVTVPAYTYDYSQPIDTQSAPPPEEVANPAVAKFDSARAAFGTGDYAGALQLTDEALKVLQNDATLHEFRALVLFAVGKYDLAAGPLYAVLSVGPGWDWTDHGRSLPEHRRLHEPAPQAGGVRFRESEVDGRPFRPGLSLPDPGPHRSGRESAQGRSWPWLPRTHSPLSSSSSSRRQQRHRTLRRQRPLRHRLATPAKQGNLAGNWTAHPAGDTTIDLRIGDDETFTWKVTAKGKPRQLTGKWSLTDNLLTLAQEGDAGRWSAVSPGKPTTSGASASSGRVPRIRGCSSPTERRRLRLEENSADPILVGILSGPGDRACFLSEFPESPVCFDSVMMYPRSVRLVGIHQFLVILEIRHRCY